MSWNYYLLNIFKCTHLNFQGSEKQPLVPHATLPAYLSRDVLTLAPYLSPPPLNHCFFVFMSGSELHRKFRNAVFEYLNVKYSSSLKVPALSQS